ncbi:MAG: hypothetical protein ACRELA_21525, partial [Candidatus Rokuibacteriota bacterium]
MRGLLGRLLGDASEREVASFRPVVDEINALEPEMERLSDDALRERAGEWRAQVAAATEGLEGEERKAALGDVLEELLP